MPDFSTLLLFMAAGVTLNVTPGPDMLYVIARSIGQGRKAGIASSCGISTGGLVHTFAAAFGLAGLIAAAPAAFNAIKYAGAVYLLYIGIRTILGRKSTDPQSAPEPEKISRIFFQGVITNVFNPKVALFFLAFLPQFVDASRGNVATQMVALGMLFNCSGTIVNTIVALGASYTGDRFKSRVGNSTLIRKLSGSVFIALGLRLALLERK